MKDKEGLIYAILFGWCGGYRFYRKEYALGILYLLTLGLFGFGWIADIIIAFKSESPTKPAPSASQEICYKKLTEVARFRTSVVGVTYTTTQGRHRNLDRQIILAGMKRKDTLHVEYYEYDLEPAYRVVLDRDSSDIGNLKATLAAEIYRKYKDCTIKVTDWTVTGGDVERDYYDRNDNYRTRTVHLNYGCNIELTFYKEED